MYKLVSAWESCSPERFAVAGQTEVRKAEVWVNAEIRDASVTKLDQMIHGLERPGGAIDVDVRERVLPRGAAKGDERQVLFLQVGDACIRPPHVTDQKAVDSSTANQTLKAVVMPVLCVDGRQQHIPAAARTGSCHASDEL
jgi:hypothetical protein